MDKVQTDVLSVEELMSEKIYTLDYFQRGYSWEGSHVNDLVNDLFQEFFNHTEESHFYFLGSVIVSKEGEHLSLVDGQQRLTSLSLLLLVIADQYDELKDSVFPLIFKDSQSEKVCTLNVKERTGIMKALYDGENYHIDGKPVSVKNIYENFKTIGTNINNKNISNQDMFKFIEWLKKNVRVAQMETTSAEDAYKIFEAANNRGVKLTEVDMFKGYILSNIDSDEEKIKLDAIWKNKIKEIENANESDALAIRTWLRASIAKSTKDFEDIGGEFHRWMSKQVREGKNSRLKDSKDFRNLIENDFKFYIDRYLELSTIARNYNPEYEAIYSNQLYQYTFQYSLILTALDVNDDNNIRIKKIKLVSTFIDILIARRLWNGKAVSHSALYKEMLVVMQNIRGNDLDHMFHFFNDVIAEQEGFSNHRAPTHDKAIRIFLARFSAWLDKEMGGSSVRLPEYTIPKKYNIEHIMPNKYVFYKDEKDKTGKKIFLDEKEFEASRNLFSALILLPASPNQSYGALPYKEKLENYMSQDMVLAKTLHEAYYKNNPKLEKIINDLRINFKPHGSFMKDEIRERQKCYTRLATEIWHLDRLKNIINAGE